LAYAILVNSQSSSPVINFTIYSIELCTIIGVITGFRLAFTQNFGESLESRPVLYSEDWIEISHSPINDTRKLSIIYPETLHPNELFFVNKLKPIAVNTNSIGSFLGSKKSLVLLLAPEDNSILPTYVLTQIVELFQSILSNSKRENKFRIFVITRYCFGPHSNSSETSFPLRSIWGLICAIRNEFPSNANILCIDTDNESYDLMLQSISKKNLNFDTVYRNKIAMSSSMKKVIAAAYLRPLRYNIYQDFKNGVALITGGLGGLGLVSAEALVEAGLHCIVLVSRSGTIKRSNQGLEQKLESLQSIPGVQIILEKCDMSVEHQVESLLARVRNLGPLKVIIHAAGLTDDRLFINQNNESIQNVWKGKADGAWYLHKYTHGVDNDVKQFILYSSVASLGMALPGTVNYSAANSYLDGFALWRTSIGLPCCSIRWSGISGGIGMVAVLENRVSLNEDTRKTLINQRDVNSVLLHILNLPNSVPIVTAVNGAMVNSISYFNMQSTILPSTLLDHNTLKFNFTFPQEKESENVSLFVLAHGYVITPILSMLMHSSTFVEYLHKNTAEDCWNVFELSNECKFNSGYFNVAMRVLESLGIVSITNNSQYRFTENAVDMMSSIPKLDKVIKILRFSWDSLFQPDVPNSVIEEASELMQYIKK
jgi:NADP-dependent 3-hydroxy acid dehydrogenase YdfG